MDQTPEAEKAPFVVAKRIREAILDEVFLPGERLTEAELTEKFEVSRSPVREALLALEKEGTVIMSPFRFAPSLRPKGWTIPPIRDPLSGDYRVADGWIRIHFWIPMECRISKCSSTGRKRATVLVKTASDSDHWLTGSNSRRRSRLREARDCRYILGVLTELT